jgi:hypothetical protein
MLSSDFKEKDAPEIPLPGKKVNEFGDLLRQIYPQIESEITCKPLYSYCLYRYGAQTLHVPMTTKTQKTIP